MPVPRPRFTRPSARVASDQQRRHDADTDRHSARRILWAESSLPRVRECGHQAISADGRIGLRCTGAGTQRTAGYAGLASCGSVWACPVCAAKIMMQRREDLAEGLGVATIQGMTVLMVTLTLRHRAGQPLAELWDAVSYAWGKVTSGAGWKGGKIRQDGTHAIGDLERYGIVGFVRAVEVTHGDNGWHPHVHAVLLLDGPISKDGADALGYSMWQRWDRAVRRCGFDSLLTTNDDGNYIGGLNVRIMTKDEQVVDNVLSKYLTKAVYSVASEASLGQISKEGRMGNRTPMQILRSVVELGDADDLDLWHEFETASKGRRAMTWSHGLRDRLGLNEERTDEEIAAEEIGSANDTVIVLPPDSWRRLRNARLELTLKHLTERDGPDKVRPWLASRDIPWLEPADL